MSDQTSHETYQLTANAAEIYETQKVVAIFRPLALATINQIDIEDSDQVVDIACGTGIVSRVLEEEYPALSRIAGVDLNEGMLGQAKSLTSTGGSRIEWYQSDVAELPFDDASFSLAICQQGLQYFPEKELALTEIRRILKPGGRLATTVWSGASPLFLAIAKALDTYVSHEIAQHSLTPFTFNDKNLIESLMSSAGYHEIRVSNIIVDRKFGPTPVSIPREIAGNPIAADVKAKGEAVMKSIVHSVDQQLASFRVREGFVVPQESYLFIANN